MNKDINKYIYIYCDNLKTERRNTPVSKYFVPMDKPKWSPNGTDSFANHTSNSQWLVVIPFYFLFCVNPYFTKLTSHMHTKCTVYKDHMRTLLSLKSLSPTS